MAILDVDDYLDRAEPEFIFGPPVPHYVFPLRRRGEVIDFYAQLESELQAQSILMIHEYRVVKEGYTRLSRPASLALSTSKLLSERPHLRLVKQEIERLADQFPRFPIQNFLKQQPADAIRDIPRLRACFEIFNYMVEHQAELDGFLPRQIPHGQSTKLIGKENLLLKLFADWRGEESTWRDFYQFFGLLDKPAEFRFFSPECICQGHRLLNFHGVLARDWADTFDFSPLSGTLIVENFETFFALFANSRKTLLIWGGGWRATQLKLLSGKLATPIYYWGDIDKEGYEIFGHLKRSIPELRPLFMDQATINRYRGLAQKKEIFVGPFKDVPSLQSEYEFVSRKGIQIEQEQIHEPWPFP